MKPHPRIRKTIKWAGAAATALLVVVWIGSGRGGAFVSDINGRGLGVHAGSMVAQTCHYFSLVDPIDFGLFPRGEWHLDCWSWKLVSGQNGWAVFIPLWAPATLALLFTAAAWRLDTLACRRAHLNLCPNCHYPLTGLPPTTPTCPECGHSRSTNPPRLTSPPPP